ncbi:DUF2523 domain-containing protein [Stenotrophomonas sp. ATCM1_4]|uniref:DUF2523 domain-containing protein n=1 Tax=Stenotrophomonas sp. ATCM1_4 TaxID=2259330 RepID=UPI001045FC8F|nr:DUF2523 domain-containing protein [Stenotrophomonas sp. ATCM1_4]TDB26200.1 DUF2523 domain-containing protein [Stenotrophomonas sp. ATCM1_4]
MPQILGALVALLIGAAREYLPGIIGRVLLAFGIGAFTHEVALPALKAFVQSKLSALGAVGVAYWDATGAGIMVTMILSAIAAALSQKVVLSKLGGK